jgi:hypothetical protein
MTDMKPGPLVDYQLTRAALDRLAEGLAALDIDAKDDPVTAALDAITWRQVDLDRLQEERDQAAAVRDAARATVRELIDRPSGHVANGAIALLASGLRNRDFDVDAADPQAVASRALAVIDNYDTALAEATRDLDDLEGGLSAEQEIRDRALGHALSVIGQLGGQKDAQSVLGASAAAVVGVALELARGFEPYIRGGAEASGVVS